VFGVLVLMSQARHKITKASWNGTLSGAFMGANKLIERTIPFPARRTDPHQSEDISSEPGKVTQK